MKNPEAFAGYEAFDFTDGPYTRRVWRKGSGPAVIVMHFTRRCCASQTASPRRG